VQPRLESHPASVENAAVSHRLGLALAVAILIGLAVLTLPGHLGEPRRGGAVAQAPTLTLGAPVGPAVTIGGHPIGLSIEYPQLAHDLGTRRCPPAALVRTLAALGSPTVRIGGDSQDTTAPAGTPPRAGVSDLPPGFWSRVACLERETGVAIVVGLNLASGEVAWGAATAAGARAAIPGSRLSFELGNEPDIYGSPVPWWNGHALVASAMPLPTYLRRAEALEAMLGRRNPVEGPDFASGRWTASVPMLARSLHLSTIDAHFYPLDACRGSAGVTSFALLERAVQTKLDERVRLARDARAAGLPAVISETNSSSCGGAPGVSDTPAAAVWAVRMILRALRAGFSSVRFHSSGGTYDPFVVTGGAVIQRPLYLGLRAAARVLAPGAVLRAIAGADSLDGVTITGPGGAATIVLSNYAATPKWVALSARSRVRVVSIVARAPTVETSTATPLRGRVRVELPANSVAAISAPRP
jgi:hypothetical protein